MNKQNGFTFERLYFPLALITILLGLTLRIRSFLTGRSLWLDEAMLALNIINRSFAGLFQQPMEYGQSSPIGYVISVKTLTLLFGDSEYSLRLYSLIAGCLALIFMAVISRNALGKSGSLIALAFFAFNPDLIYYTSETKQYISDVIATVVLIWLLQRQIRIQATTRDFVLFGFAGLIILWFSHPIIFVAAGVGITLFLHYWKNNDRKRLFATIVCGLIWGISLIILYFVNLRYLASSELLLRFWQEGFITANPNWFMDIWQAFLTNPLSIDANPLIVFVLFILGIGYLVRHNWQLGAVTILTLTLALIASGFHKYSLLGRMLLFVIPLFAISISAGMIAIGSLFKNKYLSLAALVLPVLYLIWMPVGISISDFVNPAYREHIKPTLEYLHDYKKENDLIYIYYNTGPAFRFYAPKFDLDKSNYIIGSDHSANPEAYFDEIEELVGNKRVWLLFSHVYEDGQFNEKDYILADADQIGDRIREFRVSSTSIYLYLYDFQ